MSLLLTGKTSLDLWRDVVKHAEGQCDILLKDELKAYLVVMLDRFANQPQLVKQVLATSFLESMQKQYSEKSVSLQNVGDQCLLFAGFFPQAAERRHVNLSYFVNLGQSAYSNASEQFNDLFYMLADRFVVLMDVLQSINLSCELLPLEAYEQWHELGSRRAYKALQNYTAANISPIAKRNHK